MKLHEAGFLVLLGAIWGSSYLFINIAVESIAPFFLMDARVWIAGLALFIYAILIGKAPHLRSQWKEFFILGILNSAIPFTLIASAQANPDFTASLGAILNSTTPLFTAIVAAIWLGMAFTISKITGLLLGIAGVAILVGWNPAEINAGMMLSVVQSLLAALAYGVGGVYAKKTFKGISPLTMTIGQMVGAGIFLLIPASASIPGESPSSAASISLIVLALLCTSCAYLLYFYLLEHVGPTKTLSVTFLIPVFAIIWGMIFLHEPFSAGMLAGLIMILVSVALVTEIGLRGSLRRLLYAAAHLF